VLPGVNGAVKVGGSTNGSASSSAAVTFKFVLFLGVVLFRGCGRVLGKSGPGKNAESEYKDSDDIKFDL